MHTLAQYAAYMDIHQHVVLDNLDPESVAVYRFLSQRFATCNAARDQVFQFVFRSFYRLDLAGLTRAFKAEYFQTLEALRGSDAVDLAALARRFYALPRRKGDHSLQFSFLTKLAHTLTPAYPIYDDEVATAFAFRRPAWGDFDSRLARLLTFYEQLRVAYATILAEKLLENSVGVFHTRFTGNGPGLPEIKVLDFLFWSAGKLIRTGRLANPPNLVFSSSSRTVRFGTTA